MAERRCEEVRRRGSLGERADALDLAHLDGCPGCRAIRAELGPLIDLLCSERELEPSPAIDSRIRSMLATASGLPPTHQGFALGLAVAGGLALVAGLVGTAGATGTDPTLGLMLSLGVGIYLAATTAAATPLLWLERERVAR